MKKAFALGLTIALIAALAVTSFVRSSFVGPSPPPRITISDLESARRMAVSMRSSSDCPPVLKMPFFKTREP